MRSFLLNAIFAPVVLGAMTRFQASSDGVAFIGRSLTASDGSVLFDNPGVSFSFSVTSADTILAHMSQAIPVSERRPIQPT